MKSIFFVSYEQMHKDVCETMLSAGTVEDMDKLQYILDRHSLGVMFDHNDELRAFIRESYDRLSVANNPPFPYYDTVWRVALEALRLWFRRYVSTLSLYFVSSSLPLHYNFGQALPLPALRNNALVQSPLTFTFRYYDSFWGLLRELDNEDADSV